VVTSTISPPTVTLTGCHEEQAEEVARFLERVLVAGMNEVVNPGLEADHPDWVPVEVEAEVVGSWGG
jgi:hypothetical protein